MAGLGAERATRLMRILGREDGQVAGMQHHIRALLGSLVQTEVVLLVERLALGQPVELGVLQKLLARNDELHVVIAAVRLHLLLRSGDGIVFLHVGEHVVAIDLVAAERQGLQAVLREERIGLGEALVKIVVSVRMSNVGYQHADPFHIHAARRAPPCSFREVYTPPAGKPPRQTAPHGMHKETRQPLRASGLAVAQGRAAHRAYGPAIHRAP